MSSYKWTILICSIYGLGCVDKQQFSKFELACENHVVVYDSFDIELFEVNENENKISSLQKISPKNEVIGQGIFNCQNGVLLFNTSERMKTGVDTTLHINFKNAEKKLNFKYGVNSILPFGIDEYIVREKIIRGSDGNVVRSKSPPEISFKNLDEDTLQKNTYIDDVILDVKKSEIIRKVRGTLERTEFHGGKYITYTNNNIVLDYNPTNGDRTILVEYQKNSQQDGNSLDLPQMGAQYFYLNENLYLVNGETSAKMIDSESHYLEKNKLFVFDKKNKKWIGLINLEDNPIATIHNGEKIIILSRKLAFEYNYIIGKFKKFEIPVDGYTWRSIAELQNSYFIIGQNKSNETKIFLSSKDFKSFNLISEINYMSNPKASTMLTPVSPYNILQ